MYIKDERPCLPPAKTNDDDDDDTHRLRTQQIQTEHSYLTERSRGPESSSESLKASRKKPTDVPSKISQTDTSFLYDKYIRLRDHQRPAPLPIRDYNNIHYPTEYLRTEPEPRKPLDGHSANSATTMPVTTSLKKYDPPLLRVCSSSLPNIRAARDEDKAIWHSLESDTSNPSCSTAPQSTRAVFCPVKESKFWMEKRECSCRPPIQATENPHCESERSLTTARSHNPCDIPDMKSNCTSQRSENPNQKSRNPCGLPDLPTYSGHPSDLDMQSARSKATNPCAFVDIESAPTESKRSVPPCAAVNIPSAASQSRNPCVFADIESDRTQSHRSLHPCEVFDMQSARSRSTNPCVLLDSAVESQQAMPMCGLSTQSKATNMVSLCTCNTLRTRSDYKPTETCSTQAPDVERGLMRITDGSSRSRSRSNWRSLQTERSVGQPDSARFDINPAARDQFTTRSNRSQNPHSPSSNLNGCRSRSAEGHRSRSDRAYCSCCSINLERGEQHKNGLSEVVTSVRSQSLPRSLNRKMRSCSCGSNRNLGPTPWTSLNDVNDEDDDNGDCGCSRHSKSSTSRSRSVVGKVTCLCSSEQRAKLGVSQPNVTDRLPFERVKGKDKEGPTNPCLESKSSRLMDVFCDCKSSSNSSIAVRNAKQTPGQTGQDRSIERQVENTEADKQIGARSDRNMRFAEEYVEDVADEKRSRNLQSKLKFHQENEHDGYKSARSDGEEDKQSEAVHKSKSSSRSCEQLEIDPTYKSNCGCEEEIDPPVQLGNRDRATDLESEYKSARSQTGGDNQSTCICLEQEEQRSEQIYVSCQESTDLISARERLCEMIELVTHSENVCVDRAEVARQIISELTNILRGEEQKQEKEQEQEQEEARPTKRSIKQCMEAVARGEGPSKKGPPKKSEAEIGRKLCLEHMEKYLETCFPAKKSKHESEVVVFEWDPNFNPHAKRRPSDTAVYVSCHTDLESKYASVCQCDVEIAGKEVSKQVTESRQYSQSSLRKTVHIIDDGEESDNSVRDSKSSKTNTFDVDSNERQSDDEVTTEEELRKQSQPTTEVEEELPQTQLTTVSPVKDSSGCLCLRPQPKVSQVASERFIQEPSSVDMCGTQQAEVPQSQEDTRKCSSSVKLTVDPAENPTSSKKDASSEGAQKCRDQGCQYTSQAESSRDAKSAGDGSQLCQFEDDNALEPLTDRERLLCDSLLRRMQELCDNAGDSEDHTNESLQCPASRKRQCRCCHCRDNKCQMVVNTLEAASFDPVGEMKLFIDSIIMDLEAMDHVKHRRNIKPKAPKQSGNAPGDSFPVTIRNVSSLGCRALYVQWEMEECVAIGGYEIYVDGHLTNRFFSYSHVAGVVTNVDVTKRHQIVLRAIAVGEEFTGTVDPCGCSAMANAHPEMLVGASQPWTISIYYYVP